MNKALAAIIHRRGNGWPLEAVRSLLRDVDGAARLLPPAYRDAFLEAPEEALWTALSFIEHEDNTRRNPVRFENGARIYPHGETRP